MKPAPSYPLEYLEKEIKKTTKTTLFWIEADHLKYL